MTWQRRPWILILGPAVFVGVYLALRFTTHLSFLIIVGIELSIIFLWRLIRAFVGPIAANRSLQVGQILLALPVGLYSLASFLYAKPATSDFALWVFLCGVALFFGVSRPYIKTLQQRIGQPN